MRRTLALAASVLCLATAAGAPSAAALDYVCTEEDVRRVVEDAAPRTVQDPALLASFENCQFRLYDDNDGDTPDSPEVPHTFSSDEWFVAGVLTWLTKDDLKSNRQTKKQGIAEMDGIVDRLFLGEANGPLAEVPITATGYRTVHDPEYRWLIIKHHYHVFEPGSLSPGTYEWRAEASGFPGTAEVFVTNGTLIITD